MRVATKDKRTRASPTIDDLITLFERSNVVDAKSPMTIRWYNDILKSFSKYLKENGQANGIDGFSIENAREYVLYLRSRNRFDGHTLIPQQHSLLPPQTVRGHIRKTKCAGGNILADCSVRSANSPPQSDRIRTHSF